MLCLTAAAPKRKDHYSALGVNQSASSSDIKKAYFKAAQQHHPDHNTSESSKRKFAEAAAAYEVLKDPQKRKDYDYTRSMGGAPNPQEWMRQRSTYAGGSAGPRYQQRPEYSQRDAYQHRQDYYQSRTEGRTAYGRGNPYQESRDPWEEFFRQAESQNEQSWNRYTRHTTRKRQEEDASARQWQEYYMGKQFKKKPVGESVLDDLAQAMKKLPIQPVVDVFKEFVTPMKENLAKNIYYNGSIPQKMRGSVKGTDVLFQGATNGGSVTFPTPNSPFVPNVFIYNNQVLARSSLVSRNGGVEKMRVTNNLGQTIGHILTTPLSTLPLLRYPLQYKIELQDAQEKVWGEATTSQLPLGIFDGFRATKSGEVVGEASQRGGGGWSIQWGGRLAAAELSTMLIALSVRMMGGTQAPMQ
ncbi:DnaJ protein 1, mitochondrial precursor [Planoprotostelium fungivorum]|uniref:DnaJ protein 1, mitochondrial n=1 Tax=Planoprotostelium fungivorum TaxID=1890364 RepID=A0A2P6MM73_9EUKA|nr:DnaJ protein 1, mitochondrial precursor [Planoprotostelium fungivorum]